MGLRESVNPPTITFKMCVHMCIFLEEGLLLAIGSFIHLSTNTNTLPALAAQFCYIDENREKPKK